MTGSKGTVQRTERLYEGRVLNLRLDHTRLPDGTTIKREIIEHGGAVAMVPLDDEDYVHLVRQYRPAVDRHLLEIPAGGLEPGEDPVRSAERELQEEIGMFPGKLEPLGAFYPVPGYSSEVIHLFLARDLRPSTLPGDDDEDIAVERVALDELLAQIDQGAIEDGKTIAGVLRVARHLATKGHPT
jgi:ADP-ribose pyrophosphatase